MSKKTVIKLADAPKRLRLKKMQIAGYLAHASAERRILVGFYRDESGKIRPVTKAAVEVRRKKVVKHGKSFKGVKPQFKVVKGIRMSAEEYRTFVKYLNDFRIQKFTKSDVEEWLRFHEETDSHLKKSKRVFGKGEEASMELNAENIEKLAKILNVKTHETDKLQKIAKILAFNEDIQRLKHEHCTDTTLKSKAIKTWRNEIKTLLKEIKREHPTAHKKSIKKMLKTKGYPTSMAHLRKIAKKPSKRKRMGRWKLDPLKVRKGLTNKPKVLSFKDYDAKGLIRLLHREGETLFPEFAIYPTTHKLVTLRGSFKDAGLKEESRGKWVLRTNKFNIFVYI